MLVFLLCWVRGGKGIGKKEKKYELFCILFYKVVLLFLFNFIICLVFLLWIKFVFFVELVKVLVMFYLGLLLIVSFYGSDFVELGGRYKLMRSLIVRLWSWMFL